MTLTHNPVPVPSPPTLRLRLSWLGSTAGLSAPSDAEELKRYLNSKAKELEYELTTYKQVGLSLSVSLSPSRCVCL